MRARVLLLLCSMSSAWACGTEALEWTEEEVASIYGIALRTIHQEVGRGDTLFMDVRPRFLVPDRVATIRMGAFNRYGDPALSSAIDNDSIAAACRVGPDGGCDPTAHEAFGSVSEVLPVGRREAVVLAAHARFGTKGVSSRNLVIQFRFRNGEWNVTRVLDDEAVRIGGAGALSNGRPGR